jgi:hypothetical protein
MTTFRVIVHHLLTNKSSAYWRIYIKSNTSYLQSFDLFKFAVTDYNKLEDPIIIQLNPGYEKNLFNF